MESGAEGSRMIALPEGATVADAVAAAGIKPEFRDNLTAMVGGRAAPKDRALASGDAIRLLPFFEGG